MKIKNLIKKAIITVMIASIAMGTVACSNKKSVSTMDKDVLILGFDDTFVPMGFKGDDGEYTGFDIDLAKEISKKLDKEIKLQPIDWTMKETELNNKVYVFII